MNSISTSDNVASIQQRLGPVAKTILAGTVLAASPAKRGSGWTVVLSGPEGPLTVQAVSDSTARIARHSRPGDFLVIEATLVSRGARCEIRALLMISSRETRMPVAEAEAEAGAEIREQERAGRPARTRTVTSH